MRRASHDQRVSHAIGRDARLELVFGVRGDRTVLVHGYAEPPFRVSRPFEDGRGLHMILTSSGPGVFGGDRLQQSVRVERGACVRLTSQSSLQVHPGTTETTASMTSQFDIEDEAQLTCQWLPYIPFAAASLTQRIAVVLAAGASLHWSDAFMAGRGAMGERWRFARLDHELRLVRSEMLEYLERYRLVPGAAHLTNRWIAGDDTYFGTTISSGPIQSREAVDQLHGELAALCDMRAAVDVLAPHLRVARLMSRSGPAFHAARNLVDRRFVNL